MAYLLEIQKLMCAMNEVSKIANSVLLLPIKIVNDRSCFEKGFKDEWSIKVDNAVSSWKMAFFFLVVGLTLMLYYVYLQFTQLKKCHLF